MDLIAHQAPGVGDYLGLLEKIGGGFERLTAIKVVGVDHQKGLFDFVGGHQYGVASTPGFAALGEHLYASGHIVEFLMYIVDLDVAGKLVA